MLLNQWADSSQQIFDENNGNAEGTFSVTSLRCIFVSKKKAANNIIIGYGRVTTMKITQSNGKVNLVINAFGGAASAKYDMCLHFNGESCPSSFETAISAFRFVN